MGPLIDTLYDVNWNSEIRTLLDDSRLFGISLIVYITTIKTVPMTCSSQRCPLRSHSLVCIENHLFILGIGPILNKELEFIFRSDRSDRTCVYS